MCKVLKYLISVSVFDVKQVMDFTSIAQASIFDRRSLPYLMKRQDDSMHSHMLIGYITCTL